MGAPRTVDERLAELEKLVSVLALREQSDDAPVKVHGDKEVRCLKCRSLLAYYDDKLDLFRVRFKGFLIRVRSGVGGEVWMTCPKCAEESHSFYEPPKPQDGVELVGGLVLLHRDQLRQLLAFAESAPDGVISLRVAEPGG